MLSGEYGSGKTLLSRLVFGKLLEQEGKFNVALIVNPSIPELEFLSELVYQLGGDSCEGDRKIDILHKLNAILYKTSLENKYTVVIIDEVQSIDESNLEQLWLLLNF